jgi:hypothetical protein
MDFMELLLSPLFGSAALAGGVEAEARISRDGSVPPGEAGHASVPMTQRRQGWKQATN